MEETHRQLIGDLKQQHQKEVAALLKEKDQLLQEETAATVAGKDRKSYKNKSIVVLLSQYTLSFTLFLKYIFMGIWILVN